MNLWMQIMFITVLGVITISSQAEDRSLVIPEGELEGKAVSRQKLANAIADEINDVSIVSDLSFSSKVYKEEAFINIISLGTVNLWSYDVSLFTLSFTVTTHSGTVHRDIQCEARVHSKRDLFVTDCENDQTVLSQSILIIDIDSILIEGTTDQRYIR